MPIRDRHSQSHLTTPEGRGFLLRIKSVMAAILDIAQDDIVEDFGPEDTPNWDSMNNLRLVTAIEEEFQIKLTMDDISRMVSFSQIKAVLSQNLSV